MRTASTPKRPFDLEAFGFVRANVERDLRKRLSGPAGRLLAPRGEPLRAEVRAVPLPTKRPVRKPA